MDASARGKVFLDTNVLVYAVDHRDRAKQMKAQSLLRGTPRASLVISTQVLGEFYWTVTRKLVPAIPNEEARAAVERLSRLTVVPVDRDIVRGAIELAALTSIAYWDALIVKAASTMSCERVLSEDLNHSQVIDGVRIENPFLPVN